MLSCLWDGACKRTLAAKLLCTFPAVVVAAAVGVIIYLALFTIIIK